MMLEILLFPNLTLHGTKQQQTNIFHLHAQCKKTCRIIGRKNKIRIWHGRLYSGQWFVQWFAVGKGHYSVLCPVSGGSTVLGKAFHLIVQAFVRFDNSTWVFVCVKIDLFYIYILNTPRVNNGKKTPFEITVSWSVCTQVPLPHPNDIMKRHNVECWVFVFKPCAPPGRRSGAAYLSHHAIIIVLFVVLSMDLIWKWFVYFVWLNKGKITEKTWPLSASIVR